MADNEASWIRPEGQEYDPKVRAQEELRREEGAGRKPYITADQADNEEDDDGLGDE